MRKGAAITFTWPTVEDKSWHDENEIEAKLPIPKQIGGTNRTAEKLKFKIDLAKFGSQLL